MMKLRPEVQTFAEAMETKLQANDHKPHWKNIDTNTLLLMLRAEVCELTDALDVGDASSVLYEAADVANFAMMIADVAGALAEGGR